MAKKKVASKHADYLMEGAVIGAALGIATTLLADSKSGKKMGRKVRQGVRHESLEFYRYITPKIKKAKRLGETQYKTMVKKTVAAYGRDRKLSAKEMALLLKEAQSLWAHLKRATK
ncbi:MAG: hypothetical protein M1361_01045 [Patescibacteria group bacterium]|nr:hypothetical protein [Patescibacteria group bacterium]MCL5224190.1 hypothetical protein [Patescibacteria group bacterium]